MSTVEKNDVDISPLFGWKKKFNIVNDFNGEVYTEVWMRVLGDADLNKARVYALRRSTELRKKLKNRESDERMVYLVEPDAVSKQQLVLLISAFAMRDVVKKVTKEVTIKRPVPPSSEATLEEQEKFQAEVDAYPKKRQDAIKAKTEELLKKYEKELNEKPEEELYKEYIDVAINEMCEQEVLNAFKEMSTYYGTYKDEECTERFFESFEEFQNLRTDAKESFIANFSTLEFGMDELKKLRVATP